MTTFREFLSYRNVINEDAKADWEKIENDPKVKALEAFKKEKGFSPAGIAADTTDKQKERYVEWLNDFIVSIKGNDAERLANSPKAKALENFKKKNDFAVATKADDKQKEGYVDELNDFIVSIKGNKKFANWREVEELNKTIVRNSEKKFANWDEVVDVWKKYTDDKNVHDVDTNDVADANDKMEYLKTALRKGGRIDKVSHLPTDVAKNIADAFAKADKSNDKNGKIDKEEFINAIKFIKKQAAFKSMEINAINIASLLYFVYLTRAIKSSSTGRNGPITNKYLININGKKDFNIDGIGKLNKDYLPYFSDLKFDSKVLSVFAKPNEAAAFINNTDKEKDEKQFEKIRNSFSDNDDVDEPETSSKGKKSKKNEEPPSPEEVQAAKEVEKAKKAVDDNDEKVEELKRQKEKLEEKPETGREQAISKKKFYIFDIDAPDPSDSEDELNQWFDDMKSENHPGGAMGMVAKIKGELSGYAPKSNDNDLNETIAKVFKKNGIILEDYEKTKGEIDKLIKNTGTKIENYLDGARHKALSLKSNIESNSSYTATVELRRKFKQLFIDLGYVLSQEIRSLVRATDLKMDSLKNAKKREEFNNYKTTDQLGQEEKDAEIITRFINTKHQRDEQNIAKFMLLNLLKKNSSSEEIIKYLNSNSFGSNKEEAGENAYVYSGLSKMVYALSKGDVEEDDETFSGGKVYNFKATRARVYKKPVDLFETTVGVKLEKLTPGVMKRVKRAIANDSTGEKYLQAANDIARKIEALRNGTTMQQPQASVSEGVMDFFRNKDTTKNDDYKNIGGILANKAQGQAGSDILETLKNRSHKINLSGIDPRADEPASIALRQIFKGYCLARFGQEEYITTLDVINGIKQQKQRQEYEATKKTGENNEKYYVDQMKPGGDGSGASSVVTSGNADSTYGDGYGYNKKTDAIKKKLNSTTYTYMPNSKMRIVRRTFD